jgi:hypothetical protein
VHMRNTLPQVRERVAKAGLAHAHAHANVTPFPISSSVAEQACYLHVATSVCQISAFVLGWHVTCQWVDWWCV